MHYSLPLANAIAAQGYELYGKSDLRFLQGVYGLLREMFQFQPRLTKEKFLRNGYAERKVILTLNILLLCQAKHKQLLASANKGKRITSKYKGVRVSCDNPYQSTVTREEGLEPVQHGVTEDEEGLGCGHRGPSGKRSGRPMFSVPKSDDHYPMKTILGREFETPSSEVAMEDEHDHRNIVTGCKAQQDRGSGMVSQDKIGILKVWYFVVLTQQQCQVKSLVGVGKARHGMEFYSESVSQLACRVCIGIIALHLPYV